MKKTNQSLLIGISLIAGICLIVCIGIYLVLGNYSDLHDWVMEQYTLRAGARAPDFELTSLDGEIVRLSAYNGKPVLLSIGATWCPSCREEAPHLQELHETHPELVVLLINMKESRDIVAAYAQEAGLTLPILLDSNGRVSNRYHIYAIPASFFIDRDGILCAVIIGFDGPEVLEENLGLIGVEP
jgi:thiol-disulfide isomerase/thioredoxin